MIPSHRTTVGHAARDSHVIHPRHRPFNVYKMADVPLQDRAPKQGYPGIKWARNLPRRGPSGLVTMLGGVTVMAFGFSVVIYTNRQRR